MYVVNVHQIVIITDHPSSIVEAISSEKDEKHLPQGKN